MTRHLLAAVVLVVAVQSGARAQGVVPGGWAPQFGVQTFSGPGYSGAAGFFSFGTNGMNGLNPGWNAGLNGGGFAGLNGVENGGFASGRLNPAGPALPATFEHLGQPQVADGLSPLADVVRRSTRRRHAR